MQDPTAMLQASLPQISRGLDLLVLPPPVWVLLAALRRISIFIVDTEVTMHIRVQKWGNSLAVRIPKPLAEDAKVEEGTVLNLAVSKGKVIATPVKKNKQSLQQMLAKVSRKNLHAEVKSGAPVGREIW
jgi:antitoxin MazE